MSVVGGVQETAKFFIKFQSVFQNNRVDFLLQNHTLNIVYGSDELVFGVRKPTFPEILLHVIYKNTTLLIQEAVRTSNPHASLPCFAVLSTPFIQFS
jgi:hypothetical protein